MENRHFALWLQPRLITILILLIGLFKPAELFSNAVDNISIKNYPQLALPVANPMDLTKLPRGKSYQVTHPKFILQFFFDGTEIYGIILKRDKDASIYIHWCFFKSCEESSYDYKLRIADAFTPPYDQAFFSGKIPEQLQYQFQGLEFYTFR